MEKQGRGIRTQPNSPRSRCPGWRGGEISPSTEATTCFYFSHYGRLTSTGHALAAASLRQTAHAEAAGPAGRVQLGKACRVAAWIRQLDARAANLVSDGMTPVLDIGHRSVDYLRPHPSGPPVHRSLAMRRCVATYISPPIVPSRGKCGQHQRKLGPTMARITRQTLGWWKLQT